MELGPDCTQTRRFLGFSCVVDCWNVPEGSAGCSNVSLSVEEPSSANVSGVCDVDISRGLRFRFEVGEDL